MFDVSKLTTCSCAALIVDGATACATCRGEATLIGVYGTLRLGHGNWRNFLQGAAEHVATTRTAPGHAIGFGGMARLVRLAAGDPRARQLRAGVDSVVVDVYRVSPKVLRALDGLESHPHAWRREPCVVRGGVDDLPEGDQLIEAYFWARPEAVASLESTGDYEQGGGQPFMSRTESRAQLRAATLHQTCPITQRRCDHADTCSAIGCTTRVRYGHALRSSEVPQ